MAATNDMVVVDDRRFQIRLKKPFNQMLYGFGARNCFMMPERMAATPSSEQVKEAIGSGPFRFLPYAPFMNAVAGASDEAFRARLDAWIAAGLPLDRSPSLASPLRIDQPGG